MRKALRSVVWILLLAGTSVLSFMTLGVAAPGGAAPGVPTLPTNIFSTTPPSFNSGQTQQLSSIFTSCEGFKPNPLTQAGPMMSMAMMGAMQGGTGGTMNAAMMSMCQASMIGVNLASSCPTQDIPPDVSSMSCSMFMGGGMSGMQGVMLELQIQQALCAVECKKAKALAVQGELQCMTAQGLALEQNLAGLGQIYHNNIARMEADVLAIKNYQEDRKQQLVDVNLKLNGNSTSGRKGLVQLRDSLNQAVNQMPRQIQAMRAKMQEVIRLQTSLAQQEKQRTIALDMDCFNTRTISNYRCTPNGPPQTPKDYLLCRYEQAQNLGKNGVLERNATQGAQAKASSGALESLLNQITADTASSSSIPTSAQQAEANGQQTMMIQSIGDIQKQYGSQLSAFNIGGRNALTFVTSMFANCDSRSKTEVAAEKGNINSPIGKALYVIRDSDQNFNAEVSSLLSGYSQVYSESAAGLSGQNLPPDTSACQENAPAAKRVNCLMQMKASMESLLMGTGNSSAPPPIQIKGNNPQTFINIPCKGLNGCVTALQEVSTSLLSEQSKLEKFKKDYVLTANQNVAGFTQAVATQLNSQSQMLVGKLAAISSAMVSLGGGAVVAPAAVCEKPQIDESGLVKDPDNILRTVSCKMHPPLPDLSGQGFAASLGQVGRTVSDLNQKEAQITSSLVQVQNMGPMCKQMGGQGMMDNLASLQYGAQDCHHHAMCQPNKQEATFRDINAALTRLRSEPGVMQSPQFTTLQSGVSTICDRPHLGEDKDLDEDQKKENKSKAGYSAGGCQAFLSSLLSPVKPNMMMMGGGMGGFGGAGSAAMPGMMPGGYNGGYGGGYPGGYR